MLLYYPLLLQLKDASQYYTIIFRAEKNTLEVLMFQHVGVLKNSLPPIGIQKVWKLLLVVIVIENLQ